MENSEAGKQAKYSFIDATYLRLRRLLLLVTEELQNVL